MKVLNILLVGFVFCLVWLAAFNAAFYPNCNRTTKDCFLVQHMWGAENGKF